MPRCAQKHVNHATKNSTSSPCSRRNLFARELTALMRLSNLPSLSPQHIYTHFFQIFLLTDQHTNTICKV
uniref:Uncharacterized protein n=1 Tax=Arion vulgaris TaxID=1028688 RepID=A0A0B7A4J5_9EUPU